MSSVATYDHDPADNVPLEAPFCEVCGVVVNVLFDIEAASGVWVHDQRTCYVPYIQRIMREMRDTDDRAQMLVDKVRMGMG